MPISNPTDTGRERRWELWLLSGSATSSSNAIIAADHHGLRYVEGQALLNLGEGAMMFAHAWCTDDEGRLYEVTTPAPWAAYWGIPFSTGRADDATWSGDSCVLADDRRGHPLLRQRWTGEDWTRRWPVSPALAEARRWLHWNARHLWESR